MIKYTLKTLTLILFVCVAYSCNVRDGEDPCPPEEGNVRINLYAEKFQNPSDDPLADRERAFFDRITHIRYYLYKDNALYDEQVVATFDNAHTGFYTLNFDNLPVGDYQLVVISNCTGDALTGEPDIADNLVITYPGSADTEDYFTAVFPFTVEAIGWQEYVVGLSRVHGVVRYTFHNLPQDAIAVGVLMENVSSEKWITGDYKEVCQADTRYDMVPVTRVSVDEDYVLGTFPTPTDERSSFTLSLFREGADDPYISQMIVDTLNIRRNQLLDIEVTYNNGRFDCEIILDSTWDGSNSGGEVGLD